MNQVFDPGFFFRLKRIIDKQGDNNIFVYAQLRQQIKELKYVSDRLPPESCACRLRQLV